MRTRPISQMTVAQLQTAFLTLRGWILRHTEIYFRHIRYPQRRADRISEAIALCWQWFVRLARRGKEARQFPSVLPCFAARAVPNGRHVCSQVRAGDLLNEIAQQRKSFCVGSLPSATCTCYKSVYGGVDGQRRLDTFEERLQDTTKSPIPGHGAFRCDFPVWMGRWSERDQLAHRTAERGGKALTWPALPGTLRDLEQVVALAGQRPVLRLQGAEASSGQLLRELPQARWAHLATHGFFAEPRLRSVWQVDEQAFERLGRDRAAPGARNPLVLSGLVLAGANRAADRPDGGIVTAEAIAALPLRQLKLAVLSACETGLTGCRVAMARRGPNAGGVGRGGGRGRTNAGASAADGEAGSRASWAVVAAAKRCGLCPDNRHHKRTSR